MTIYAQHPNRGKVQILAAYLGPAGATASTVTSVDSPALATPIVDALNRVSALATVPVSVWDDRSDYPRYYPQEHLSALTDRLTRADLLTGAHSLWYELVKSLLHQALTDLDNAMAAVPSPVQTAVDAELQAEARALLEELDEFSHATPVPDTASRRYWSFGAPFVTFEGGISELSGDVRDRLNQLEDGITAEERQAGVADLRLMIDAYQRYGSDQAVLEIADFAIFDDPFGEDRYYLSVDAPHPNAEGHHSWLVEIGQWIPDDPEDDESSATGNSVLSCTCPEAPAATDIAELLKLSAGRPEQLTAWAKTPVGDALDGTKFVVTERNDG